LLNGHLPLELLLLLSDLFPLQVQCCRVVRGSSAAAKAHGSSLVLLFNVNGLQHANHVALSHINPNLAISPAFIWASLREGFLETIKPSLLDCGIQVFWVH
jgi:hypothetical protein